MISQQCIISQDDNFTWHVVKSLFPKDKLSLESPSIHSHFTEQSDNFSPSDTALCRFLIAILQQQSKEMHFYRRARHSCHFQKHLISHVFFFLLFFNISIVSSCHESKLNFQKENLYIYIFAFLLYLI